MKRKVLLYYPGDHLHRVYMFHIFVYDKANWCQNILILLYIQEDLLIIDAILDIMHLYQIL